MPQLDSLDHHDPAEPSQTLLVGGQRISATAADQAAEWLTLLMSGEATEEDKLRWQQWREADPDHAYAWQHLETVTGWLGNMQPKVAYGALSPYALSQAPKLPGRRKIITLLSWGGVLFATGAVTSRTNAWQRATADHRTAAGEQRSITLEDGTRVTLNTATAIDVRFDDQARVVRLLAGEIAIMTRQAAFGGPADPRPLYVQTVQGRIQALGTHFVVRQWDGHTAVAVLQSAVEIVPAEIPAARLVVKQGERILFTRIGIGTPAALDEPSLAWIKGQIVADNIRLGDFMAELARYLPGVVRCAPAVADLRFSGVFPLNDIDRILAILPNVLPVQVKLRTRYWVAVEGAPSPA
ncbi:FecR domain-containing protein [Methylobacillus arboreus]|uniref:FecR domain-containing protein n=1 Tax=Methylobacillus arboreus TaxID=755170 RepID=UPI001E4D07B6|nr:FecR domain-containing protein [Methylobacillus arboreus]MCB5190107.1 FecR domain-containing protein [Methylobacillus arboreus]